MFKKTVLFRFQLSVRLFVISNGKIKVRKDTQKNLYRNHVRNYMIR
jgi:hypothetical protein